MLWNDALRDVATLQRTNVQRTVSGVAYDSRRVQPGDIFVAMRGEVADGNRFVAQALQRGAAAIVTDSAEVFAQLHQQQAEVGVAQVQHGRRALAGIAAALLGHPEQRLKVSAVTGTNGKTTTAFLLEQLLRHAGRKCVLIGTVTTRIVDAEYASEHTTPEASDLYRILAEGVKAGATEVVMEMSSHALAQERVWGVPVDVGIFTNLTQDHLDYHGTMENYAAAKARMFAGVGAPPARVAVLNGDDAAATTMQQAARGQQVIRYGVRSEGLDYRAANLRLAVDGAEFDLVTPQGTIRIHSPLTGEVNCYNLLGACCAALARGLSLSQVTDAVASLQQVPGRFQVVPGSRHAGFTVVVDYAHTDDALRNLIALARSLVRPQGGRVITLFGCGGDRDRTKRPKMGRAAGEGSDLVVLTSDNPRSEDPEQILAQALVGVQQTQAACVVEADRARAIASAIHAARPGDIVLLAGKGHEKVQLVGDVALPFDDVAVAAAVLKERV
ncbi:MAG: UDP-N-acetylmuramoyl-L-alanyl-D-glutamate--2,6-diaminopimelate ligase [Acidobacteriota bacterium]|nr:UDP-N-acetylmuramoyl-L-alanyl-D-glutamate--2,6-diaminopimelate ligase [Acidobacteriota bacterium]